MSDATWGDGFLTQLSRDSVAKQAVSQLSSIPWGHNLVIVSKCHTVPEASFYVANTVTHGWSRAVLTHQIESGLYQREGKAITNFVQTLAAPQSDLAQQALVDQPTIEELEAELGGRE